MSNETKSLKLSEHLEQIKTALQLADALPELNPSNYEHDDACHLNTQAVEASLAAGDALLLIPRIAEALEARSPSELVVETEEDLTDDRIETISEYVSGTNPNAGIRHERKQAASSALYVYRDYIRAAKSKAAPVAEPNDQSA